MAMNYYSVLNVDYGVGKEELKKAYRKMVMQYHPDRCDLPNAKERFLQVQQAYEFLSKEIAESVSVKMENKVKKPKSYNTYSYYNERQRKKEDNASEVKDTSSQFNAEEIHDFSKEINTAFGKLPLIIKMGIYAILLLIASFVLLRYGYFLSIIFISVCIVFELFRAMLVNSAQYNFQK